MTYQLDDAMAEFGQLFNFDQATAPSQAQKGKTLSPQFTAPRQENSYIPPQQQTFQGPSHQYELFRQQSSLAPGAFLSMHQSRQVPSQSFGPTFEVNDTDAASFGGMDMDFPDMFDTSSVNGFVDPSTVGAGSEAGDASPVAQPVQRLYPGSHQQHAAAKEQQKKMEQQKLQEQQRMAVAQQQLGNSMQATPAAHQRRPSQARNKPSDPLVEERISQILRSMRQNNARNDSSATPQPVMTQPAKQRKDEEDMDEDERLLASEEGKRLSSKERRQLRNKVSARAFRSRRKEYISQLEGELQGKTQEADELSYENDALRAENAQLTDLARMLLSQPAFNNVLEDLAARGSPMGALMPSQPSQHRGSVPQVSAPMTVPPAPQQSVAAPMDFSTPMDGWNSSITAPDFNFNPNVFAVTELPEPTIETSILSGKEISNLPTSSDLPSEMPKADHPIIERHTPKIDYPVVKPLESADCNDLFDGPVAVSQTRDATAAADNMSTLALSGKASSSHIELVSLEEARTQDRLLDARFAALCERLDAVSDRIGSMISRS